MKVKCKKCHVKYKLKHGEKAPCKDTNCWINYGVPITEVSFSGFDVEVDEDRIKADFESPKPYTYGGQSNVCNVMSDEAWEQMIEANRKEFGIDG